jgi:hypothetical protein
MASDSAASSSITSNVGFRNDKRWPSIVGDSLVFSSVTELSSDALVRIRICRLNILYDLDGEDFDYAGFYSGQRISCLFVSFSTDVSGTVPRNLE